MSAILASTNDLINNEIQLAHGNQQALFELQPKAYNLLLEEFRLKAQSKDPLKKLEEICKTYLIFGLKNPKIYQLMFTPILEEGSDVVRLHPETDTQVYRYFTDCLETCLRRELLHFKSAQIAALQIWSMMHGLVSLQIQSRIGVVGVKNEVLLPTLLKTIDDFLNSVRR